MDIIAFNKVNDEFGWLSNMAPISVHHVQFEWRTAEALFQALRFQDEKIRAEIRHEKSPMGAKMCAKKYKKHMTVEPMSENDLTNMRMVVQAKFEQHIIRRLQLVRTGTNLITEDCTHRKQQKRSLFWGAALNEQGEWIGGNHLGHILMDVRAKFNEQIEAES